GLFWKCCVRAPKRARESSAFFNTLYVEIRITATNTYQPKVDLRQSRAAGCRYDNSHSLGDPASTGRTNGAPAKRYATGATTRSVAFNHCIHCLFCRLDHLRDHWNSNQKRPRAE